MRKRKQDLSEVTRMVFVEVDPVVMLTTSVSTTSGMLPVLADPDKIGSVLIDLKNAVFDIVTSSNVGTFGIEGCRDSANLPLKDQVIWHD